MRQPGGAPFTSSANPPRCGIGATPIKKTDLFECTPELAIDSTPGAEWRTMKFSSAKGRPPGKEDTPPRPFPSVQSPPMIPKPLRTMKSSLPQYPAPTGRTHSCSEAASTMADARVRRELTHDRSHLEKVLDGERDNIVGELKHDALRRRLGVAVKRKVHKGSCPFPPVQRLRRHDWQGCDALGGLCVTNGIKVPVEMFVATGGRRRVQEADRKPSRRGMTTYARRCTRVEKRSAEESGGGH